MMSDSTMKRCKACNYVAYDHEIKGVCPACGLNEKVFEPYEPKATGLRHQILDVHFHSIGLHIPQAVGPILIILYAASFVFLPLRNNIFFLMEALAMAYPLAVLPAIVTGVVDGKLRFKKALTPLLKKKLLLAIVVLIITVGISIFTIVLDDFAGIVHYIAGATVVSLYFQGTLARMGIRMVDCMMPGK